MSEATAFQNAIPDGWYDDPAAPNMQRWWSGTEWTDHVRYSDRPRPYVAAAEPAPAGSAIVTPVAFSPAPLAPASPAVLPPVTASSAVLAPVTAEWPSAPAQAGFAASQTEMSELASGFNDLYVPMRHWQIGSVSSAQLVRQRRSAKVVVLWVVVLAVVGIAAGVTGWLLLPR